MAGTASESGKFGTTFWLRLSSSTYLAIIRNALTLMLPIVIAGATGILINNFPVQSYQRFMLELFGPTWRSFGGYVWNGTLAIMSPIMVFTIGNSIAEAYNARHPLDSIHPVIVGLVSFCSLMTIVEPVTAVVLSENVVAIPYQWVGIHGLFLSIIIALVSSETFLWLYDRKLLRVRFFSEEASVTIANAFAALLPGVLTIFAFALFKVIVTFLGIPDIHRLFYEFLYLPFVGLGNTLSTALLYNFIRHMLWFFGIHGSNALEPVMTQLYVTAMEANNLAALAGEPLPYVLTKTFFDSYISMGGAGNTMALLIALAFTRQKSSQRRIAQISVLPALFNINETLLFGLPIVLNPIFAVPFIMAPLVSTVMAYSAISWGLVPASLAEVSWTTPIFLSGYVASGSIVGSLLQLVNLLLGILIYLPFVRASENVQKAKFDATYKELLQISGSLGETTTATLIGRTDDIGSFSRALANDLLLALRKKQLFLEYQPQVDCRTGQVIGVEALLRWKHERIGRIPPSLFIPLAEEIDFIQEIGLWVCDESCRQLKEWQEKGLTETVMSFNLSVKQLGDPDLPEKILGRIRYHGVEPEYVKVEVTESTGLSSDMGHNILLQEIRRMGVNIAIDDFGMGHTSLVYLKQFPVATLKLDGSLVRDITVSKISSDIILTISELCRSMNIQLLAEFVETEQQALMLKERGCYIFQGYLYSPALSPENCERAIRQGFRTY